MDVPCLPCCSISTHLTPSETWMFSILVWGQMYFPGCLLSEVEDLGMFDCTGSNHKSNPHDSCSVLGPPIDPLTPHYPKFILLKHHNEGFTGPIAGFI